MPIDSPFDSLVGIRSPFGNRRASAPLIITATTSPSLAALTDGDTLSSAVTWGSYTSSAGTITGTVREMSVNGAAFAAYDGATVVAYDNTYTLRETVTDSAGNSRTFGAGTQTVQTSGEWLLALDGDDLILSAPQILVLTGDDLILEAA